MKHLLLILLFMAGTLAASAQDAFFRKYQNTKGVETVFISKEMLDMMDENLNLGKMKVNTKGGGKLSRIDRIMVLSCDENAALTKKIKAEALKIYSREPYKKLMVTNKDGNITYVYNCPHGNKNELVLLTINEGKLNIVNILGYIDLLDIQRFK